jgi:hypothetical protein
MSMQASTAALCRICQRLFLRQQRVPCHSASGFSFKHENGRLIAGRSYLYELVAIQK